MKKYHLRQTLLALGVAACLIPTYAQSQSMGGSSSSSKTMDSHSSSSSTGPAMGNQPGSMPGNPSSSTSTTTMTTTTKGGMASDQGMTEADRSLNTRMREALNADSSLRDASQTMTIHSASGVVTLSGTVATEKEKSDLESKLQHMAGVNKVENNLQIAPRTSSSSEIDDTTASR